MPKMPIFLSYPDEPHHLAKEENQKNFSSADDAVFRSLPGGGARAELDNRGVSGTAVPEICNFLAISAYCARMKFAGNLDCVDCSVRAGYRDNVRSRSCAKAELKQPASQHMTRQAEHND